MSSPSLQISDARARLEGSQVDYEGVMATKMKIARHIFDNDGAHTLESEEYKVQLTPVIVTAWVASDNNLVIECIKRAKFVQCSSSG